MIYSNYGKRAIAYILDLLFVFVPAGLMGIVGIVLVIPESTRGLGVVLLITAFLWLLLAGLYNEVFRQGRDGQTIGKRQQGVMLIREDTGQVLGFGFAFLRVLIIWFFNFLTAGIYLIADLLAPAFTAKKQRLTDKLLSTVVIDVGTNIGAVSKQGAKQSWSPPVIDDLP